MQANGLFTLEEKKQTVQGVAQPYDKTINGKVIKETADYPKLTFESKEVYERAQHLCQQIPHWKTEQDNPIHQYVPESERPFKNTADDFFSKKESAG